MDNLSSGKLDPKRGQRILVVEDDAHLNKLISYNLAKLGCAVESVYDGLSALEKISKEIFDVVVLDIMLPNVSGFRICELLKENSSSFHTRVVILTARAEPLDKIYGESVGADCYLTKPFSVLRLVDIVTCFLNGNNQGSGADPKGRECCA